MLCSKSFASWTSTFDSLSCMVCPAVFSQWSLAFFFCLGGLFVGVGAWWQMLLVLDAFNLKCRRALLLLYVSGRVGDETAILKCCASHPTEAAPPSLCGAARTYKHTFGSPEALGALLPAMSIWSPFSLFYEIFLTLAHVPSVSGSCTGAWARPYGCALMPLIAPPKESLRCMATAPCFPEGRAGGQRIPPARLGLPGPGHMHMNGAVHLHLLQPLLHCHRFL